MIQIKWWWSNDVPDRVWSSDNDLDRVMIQIQMNITWRWRWLEDEDGLKIELTWRWRWRGLDDVPDDTKKKTCADKLCRENTFLVKRECLCNCNFKIYSLVFIMYCNPIFILGCICNVLESCHAPMFLTGSFYNKNKSCQVKVVNPPIVWDLKSPQFRGTRVIRLT